MAISRTRGCVYALLGTMLLLMGSCWLLLDEMMTERIHTYKPVEAVARGDQEELGSRCSNFELPEATVCMEWFTYDNDVINHPPYKLTIRVSPRTTDLRRVTVEDVSLSSSRGRRYAFADSIRFPVAVGLDTMRSWLKLEPALAFDHRGGETIRTQTRLRLSLPSGDRVVVLRTRWVPTVVERFSPIV
ncbi:hypothetical protein [Longimicrobium terrae]|uniref:Uncharacterized protein n=1 Tax=Longimicrobium terrae TaxID=1639882 RepID=A0A841GJV3_9BACT|nr:hypothetical protein [Longimicrobium terrae]MBB4634253.1 hypothetical protein [Longimicrobium terrae]MBB6068857.1 hypothetical protein [Longimicrobium terrae]NNC28037.1 hypothetical protein [Longimicrobium terrae]